MAVVVNDFVLRTHFSEHVAKTRISSSAVRRLSLQPMESQVQVSVSVTAKSSIQILACTLLCVVDDLLDSSELLLGMDWLTMATSLLAGLEVVFDNLTLRIPELTAERIMHTHVGSFVSASSGVASSSLAPGSPKPQVAQVCPALEIIADAFFHDFRSGARTSIFSSSTESLRIILQLHGVRSDNLSKFACRNALITHYVSGNCFNNSCHTKSADRSRDRAKGMTRLDDGLRDVSTCKNIASSFSSQVDLTTSVLNMLTSSSEISTEELQCVIHALAIRPAVDLRNPRRSYITALRTYAANVETANSFPVLPHVLFAQYEKFKKADLLNIAAQHGLSVSDKSVVDTVKHDILFHVARGSCVDAPFPGCRTVCEAYPSCDFPDANSLIIYLFTSILTSKSRKLFKRVLALHAIPFCATDGIHQLRRHLRSHIASVKRGKRLSNLSRLRREEARTKHANQRDTIRQTWPQLVPTSLKDKILSMFLDETSSEALAMFTCGSCAASYLKKEQQSICFQDIELTLLHRSDSIPSTVPMPILDSKLRRENPKLLLDPAGVVTDNNDSPYLLLCKECHRFLKKGKRPPLSLANRNYLGPVPNELQDLTIVEEAIIAKSRAKSWIVQLTEEKETINLPNAQRGLKGHVIIYPQRPSEIARVLPPSLDDVLTPICVLFVGSTPPTAEWLRNKAKPLCVRREKIRNALLWLQKNNPLYFDIQINEERINALPVNGILPFHIEHVLPSNAFETLTSRYDATPQSDLANDLARSEDDERQTPFENVVITDVDVHAPAHELRAAALRHIKEKGKGYIQVPHDPQPVNEFFNPQLLPQIYPTLYPFGIGGCEDPQRPVALSFSRHIKHLFNLSDRRFQEHYSFLFTTFNILQRRTALLHTSLKVKKRNFERVAAAFGSVSPETVHIVSERVARGDVTTVRSAEEKKVLELLKQVQAVTSHVPGSASSKLVMRNEIRALMIEKGMPSFYLTINPADVYNPIVKFLAGSEIDIDKLTDKEVPNYRDQSILVAKNPAIAAKFFNLYMKAFISTILAFDSSGRNLEGGILGVVKAYYGCVEAQGRGTLHCHMLIWLEGGLNPTEIKNKILRDNDKDFQDRLLAFLDDTISNCIPRDPDPCLVTPSSSHHPCSVRSIKPISNNELNHALRRKDLHHLVTKCQRHSHTHTCYKYWKGPPEPRECRFDLHEDRVRTQSSIDSETGEICLRCLDGLVNNFNETILHAVRCNMDIKFIGSGAAAKAMIYYVTDYITKAQLKAHVAYAALDSAIKKVGEYNPTDTELDQRAKRLLQRSAYALISQQELSAQQVASYVMDFEDHFTSHSYRNLYWTSFENIIRKCEATVTNNNPSLTNEQQNECDIENNANLGSDVEEDDNSDEDDNETEDLELINETSGNQDLNDHNVNISTDQNGQLIAQHSDQVIDYVLRGQPLSDMNLWMFMAQIQKVRRSQGKNNSDIQTYEESNPLEYTNEVEQSEEPNNQIPFQSTHPDYTTHELKRIRADMGYVPVPIGPSLPHRDQKDSYDRYCRLMLIFFKPWNQVSDLREGFPSWAEAFTSFIESPQCEKWMKDHMENMQLLHDCKTSRDDHFAQRAKQRAKSKQDSCSTMHNDFNMLTDDDDDIETLLTHLESIDACSSERKTRTAQNVDDCISKLEKSGMFTVRNPEANQKEMPMQVDEPHTHDVSTDETTAHYEDIWKVAYDTRRDAWKACSNVDETEHSRTDHPFITEMTDGSTFRNAATKETHRLKPSIENASHHVLNSKTVNEYNCSLIDETISSFTLNNEQARALRMIAEQSLLNRNADPLRMLLIGPGGTGKSRVIDAVREFFNKSNQKRRLRLASYTGVAARNISGMTLHAALCLNQRARRTASNKTQRDLVNMWEGVDFLLVDEISMIGCSMLLQISEALNEAKGNTEPFGGINIIFAGDFCQLPPVGQTRLFSRMHNSQYKAASKRGQNDTLGKLLWLSITQVVGLHEVMRQAGPDNAYFVSLLMRLRNGKCNLEDYETLNGRLVDNVKPNWKDWQNVPIIVSDNATKDAINNRATITFAQNTHAKLDWYYASDQRGGKIIHQETLENYLQTLDSGQTNQRLGKIPLAIGMPVMVTQNFDVSAGIVNGTTGILQSIRYYKDNKERRHAVSCVIKSTSITGPALQNLTKHEAAILQDSTDMQFIHPHSQKKCMIKRTQLPIIPAFAMTTHKAQGQTMTQAILDLQSCKGTEAPYVMLSRVKSLNGLLILRPFEQRKIQCRQSEELRAELKRLECLRLQTLSNTKGQSMSPPSQDSLERSTNNDRDDNLPTRLHKQTRVTHVDSKTQGKTTCVPQITREPINSTRNMSASNIVQQTPPSKSLPTNNSENRVRKRRKPASALHANDRQTKRQRHCSVTPLEKNSSQTVRP